MIPTGGAGKRATLAHAVESAFNAAGPTPMPLAKANIKDVLQAGLIIRKSLEEFAKAEVWDG